jgi:predicted RNase H-like HicB family nuclease
MLTSYIQAAMRHATYEWLPNDGLYYAEIPELPGVWATSADRESVTAALQDALEGWIALGLSLHYPMPAIDGHTVRVAQAS